jgi:hypothetical protein
MVLSVNYQQGPQSLLSTHQLPGDLNHLTALATKTDKRHHYSYPRAEQNSAEIFKGQGQRLQPPSSQKVRSSERHQLNVGMIALPPVEEERSSQEGLVSSPLALCFQKCRTRSLLRSLWAEYISTLTKNSFNLGCRGRLAEPLVPVTSNWAICQSPLTFMKSPPISSRRPLTSCFSSGVNPKSSKACREPTKGAQFEEYNEDSKCAPPQYP